VEPAVEKERPAVDRIGGRSMPLRVALVLIGIAALVLGAVGVFVPLLPTTPFVILAAACFARSSTRFHRWITANRVFGPTILEWEEHRSIPRRTKAIAIGLMLVTIGSSIVFFIDPPWARISAGILAVALTIWLALIPTRPAPMPGEPPR